MEIEPAPRPTEWAFASPDANVLLVGSLVDPATADLTQGAFFELAPGGLYIGHPSLVAITATQTTQTLYCLSTGGPILSLPISSNHTFPALAKVTVPVIVTLHQPLLTPITLEPLLASPLYSRTFSVLLDGPDFAPPRFDPAQIPAICSSAVNPTYSPAVQPLRDVLSPLLSPQRRGHSQGSDLSVPPLNLNLSRARRSSSLSRPPPTLPTAGLYSLLPATPTPDALAAVVHDAITADARTTADEIMQLRRDHEAFALRVKAELQVLEARAMAGLAAYGAAGGATVIVRGFGGIGSEAVGRSPSPSRGRSGSHHGASLERPSSLGLREASEEEIRGRSRDVGVERDEEVSRLVQEADRAEEEARGRSRSRTRRGEAPPTSGVDKGKGKAKAVPQPGQSISATIDEGDEGVAIPDPADEDEAPDSPPPFVPSSYALISIPESEELSLPSTSAKESLIVEPWPTPAATPSEDDESSDHEAVFDMDEDIDLGELDEQLSHEPLELDDPSPPPAASPPPISMSFRAGSYRPSGLASSFANLLSTSLAKATPPKRPVDPPFSSFKASGSAPRSLGGGFASYRPVNNSSSPSFLLSERPPDAKSPMEPSAGEDATISSTYVDPPSLEALRAGEQAMRKVLALDAPSHRANLPRKRDKGKALHHHHHHHDAAASPEEEEDEEADVGLEQQSVARAFMVGSLPISIGPPPSRLLASAFDPLPERELMRKTSVPHREGMFVPRASKYRTASQSEVVRPTPTTSTAGGKSIPIPSFIAPSRPKASAGPSSLAQSLRNPPLASFLSRTMVEDDEEDGSGSDGEGGKGRGESVESDGFVPPHVWREQAMTEEEQLSRSIPRL